MKKIRAYEVDFIEDIIPNINGPHNSWSNEKIIYYISTKNIIWYTPIKVETIVNNFLEINGKFMKSLFRFIDGSEKELYINLKWMKSEKITEKVKESGHGNSSVSKYKKEFDKIIKDIESD